MQWLILIHRYTGILIGLVMLMWCLSGAVMLFVPYPSLGEAERLSLLAPLPPFDMENCCRMPGGLDGSGTVSRASVEMLGAAPVLRLKLAEQPDNIIDLRTGNSLSVGEKQVRAAAARAATTLDLGPLAVSRIASDQWTVSGEFDGDRPFYTLSSAGGTDLYFSSHTGALMQMTTRSQRFWNNIGSVPHWLYWQELRSNPQVWSQIVIWSAIIGTFLTVTGLVLGWLRFRRGSALGSPYSGIQFWHHVSGLFAGLLLLAWVASGLLSMNPWGLLESDGSDAGVFLSGPKPAAWRDVAPALQQALWHAPAGTVRLEFASFDDQVFFIATTVDGSVHRLDAQGGPAPFNADIARAAMLLTGNAILEQKKLVQSDSYQSADARHEVYLIVATDKDHTRYYIDAETGKLLQTVDANAKGYRWLFEALHRWDFVPTLQQGPVHAVLVLLLLAGATAITGTGVYIGARRVFRDVRRIRPGRGNEE